MSLLAQVQFVSGVVFNSFLQQPTALALLLVTVCATAAILRLLSKKTFATSPHLILPLLIILLGILHKSFSLQAELVASEAVLEEKSWGLLQSKSYRTQLLQQLSTRSDFEENENEELSANPLDGCTHVYIDIASSSKGLQIKKIFQPQLFQGDSALPIFQR